MCKNDLVGRKFGMLTVLGRDHSFKDGKRTKWICQCECGNVKSVYRDALVQGRSKSCGCQLYKGKKGINATHGMSQTRLYKEWVSMRKRCKPNSPNALYYHDRGITVCPEWESEFMPFYNWAMTHGYDDSLTIDRIDNNKGYSPDNCRWITIEEQQANKSNTVMVEYDGKEYCLRTLCQKIGFPYKTAHRRLRKLIAKGMPIDCDKLFAPINKNKISFKYRK